MESELKKETDYYFNKEGLIVFTKEYHLKKGICCGNGCLHCPFEFENVPEPKRSKLVLESKKTNP